MRTRIRWLHRQGNTTSDDSSSGSSSSTEMIVTVRDLSGNIITIVEPIPANIAELKGVHVVLLCMVLVARLCTITIFRKKSTRFCESTSPRQGGSPSEIFANISGRFTISFPGDSIARIGC